MNAQYIITFEDFKNIIRVENYDELIQEINKINSFTPYSKISVFECNNDKFNNRTAIDIYSELVMDDTEQEIFGNNQ